MDKFVTAKSRFEAYAAQDENSFEIAYEDIVSKTQRLQRMFEFLGIEYSQEIVDKVLDRPHSVGQQKKIQQLRRLELG